MTKSRANIWSLPIFCVILQRKSAKDHKPMKFFPLTTIKQLLVMASAVLFFSCEMEKKVVEDDTNVISKFNCTWNIYEKCQTNDDGTVVYKSVPWGGLVGTFLDKNMPVDLSAYESITFEFAEPTTVPTQILVADRFKTWGENSAPYQVRVMGNFPTQGEDTLIPLLWIELAMERWEEVVEGNDVQLGVDVAAYGSDKTVIAIRRGNKLTELRVYSQKNTRETAGLVHQAARENNARHIAVDEIGISRGVVDSLEEEGYENVGVNVAEKSSDVERYHNLRAELWWGLRERLNPEKEPIALPPDDELLSELASVKYKVDARGAIQIESKEEMKKRLGHSPDRADAVVLAFSQTKHEGYVSSVGDMYISKFV